MRAPILDKLFVPVLAPMLETREALAILGVTSIHVGLTFAGLSSWQCPFKAATGIPCPGCYLATAMSLLLRGKWQAALSAHIFAPIFLAGFIVIGIVTLLPNKIQRLVIHKIATFEQQTGLIAFILFGMIFYWGFRLFWLGFR